MQRAFVLAIVLAVAGTIALAISSSHEELDCATTLDYRGRTYDIFTTDVEIKAQDNLGRGRERSCGGDRGSSIRTVGLARLVGVDPRTALVTPVAANVLYVAQGTSIDELPSDIAEKIVP